MNQQLQNLITLRDKVFPIVFEQDKFSNVNLNIFKCGTQKCLLGWYGHITGYNYRNVSATVDKEHFGICEWARLFGGAEFGTLQDRYNYLCKLIDEKLAEERPSGSEICKQFLQQEHEIS